MPAMSALERAMCRSLPWRLFTEKLVVPWAVPPSAASGDVLELGSGAGANAAALLARDPDIRLTATDVDPHMVEAARRRLADFGNRVSVREADATALPFDDASFDTVVTFIMLHHVIDWEAALREVARVLRPGATVAGYDLAESTPTRLLHRIDRSPHRFVAADELRAALHTVGFDHVDVAPALGGLVVRFRAVRAHRSRVGPVDAPAGAPAGGHD